MEKLEDLDSVEADQFSLHHVSLQLAAVAKSSVGCDHLVAMEADTLRIELASIVS